MVIGLDFDFSDDFPILENQKYVFLETFCKNFSVVNLYDGFNLITIEVNHLLGNACDQLLDEIYLKRHNTAVVKIVLVYDLVLI